MIQFNDLTAEIHSNADVQTVQGCKPVLAEPVQVARPTASVLRRLTAADLNTLDLILSEPVEFIASSSFDDPRTEQKLFGHKGDQDATGQMVWPAEFDATPRITPSGGVNLTTDEERTYFLRMNYARFRMVRILENHRTHPLTFKAVRELLFWHNEVLAARIHIVQANVGLVLAMARRSRLGAIDPAEMISEGNMALLRSVDKFDCGRGFKFSTYACRAILKSFSRVASRCSRYRNRFPTEFDPTLERSDFLEMKRTTHELDCVDELRDILKLNAAELNEIEVKVLQERFALNQPASSQPQPKTLEQVGLIIGVTKERVRQIQNRALAKLRDKLQNDFLAA